MKNLIPNLSLAIFATLMGLTSIAIVPVAAQGIPVEITRRFPCNGGFAVETFRSVISICPGANGAMYVGEAKDGSGYINLSATSPEDQVYVSRNSGFTYTLNLKEQKLIITTPNGESFFEDILRVINS
ncbi:MAG: hypothetical protein HC916_00080 [Coleofasciculaceae cyanobacterium SM2_1_6]|nr:hypothetical protein [Coleofasciculaceae cyanobacterium SM2_1_6]